MPSSSSPPEALAGPVVTQRSITSERRATRSFQCPAASEPIMSRVVVDAPLQWVFGEE